MQHVLKSAIDQLNTIILGKEHSIKLALTTLLAEGHLLIEDLPGMGKTTLSHALAQVLGLSYNRVQFTSDILPADILGVSVFEPKSQTGEGAFVFHPGPIFNQLVLADEINRATPNAQSALLEAMEESQVTVEGSTRALPTPFFVIATQNPQSQAGTFALPESQLDRFLMCISLGYPSEDAERALLEGSDRRDLLKNIAQLISTEDLNALQLQVRGVKCSASLLDYVQRIVHYTRHEAGLPYGLSPRGVLGLLKAAKSWALLHDRNYVIPEDVQQVLPAVIDHRLMQASDGSRISQVVLNAVNVL
jgi:MoxR-like ATPase